jgi:hypothetical protein
LLLFDVNIDRLGRLIRNHNDGTKSRTAAFKRHGRLGKINLDLRLGTVFLNAVSSIQELLDRDGSTYRLQRILVPISNSDWLPD